MPQAVSQPMLEAGACLASILRDAGLIVEAAAWRYIPEADTWRLFVVIPAVRERGPRALYTQIDALLPVVHQRCCYQLQLQNISVVEHASAHPLL